MTESRREPVLGSASFNRPHCGALAQQTTAGLTLRPLSTHDLDQAAEDLDQGDPQGPRDMAEALGGVLRGSGQRMGPAAINFDDRFITRCFARNDLAYWHGETMAWPPTRRGRRPTNDMPTDVAVLYEEARDIAQRSPRGAATLLRVALELLVNELVTGTDSLNDKIGTLVRDGLSVQVQRAMDSARVFGNEGAHPGELDLSDTLQTTDTLFDIINFIVQQVITDKAAINDLYARLPQSKQDAIDRRDAKR
jgi:Domain of unknown function (DUF4145)